MLRQDVARDWRWSDRYLAQVDAIISLHAHLMYRVEQADPQADMQQATDMLLTFEGTRSIAVRLRRAYYRFRDMTIRTVRVSGAMTELEKINAGHGDYYLYGWTQGDMIAEWMLVDLHRLRASGLLRQQWRVIHNRDAATGFIAISYKTLRQQGCVVAAQVKGTRDAF